MQLDIVLIVIITPHPPPLPTNIQVTPLWLAAVSGQQDVVGLLLEAGADVNAKASSGSSVLRATCCMGRVDVVKQLLVYNPRMHDDNPHHVTCLMNAVHNPELLRVLVARGAKVNETDVHGNTALHHAVSVGRLESVKMLHELGANPATANTDGFNAVQMAAKERQSHIVEYLLRNSSPKINDMIEAYEVLGITTILEVGDVSSGIQFWERALGLRQFNKSRTKERRPRRTSVLADIDSVCEISSVEDLKNISSHHDAVAFQALLMYERIRGSRHESFFTMLMYRGAALADANKLRQAFHMWKLSYQLYHDKYLQPQSKYFDFWNPGLSRCLHFLVKVLREAKCEQLTQHVDCDGEFDDSCLIPECMVRAVCGLAVQHVLAAGHGDVMCERQSSCTGLQTMASLVSSCLSIFSLYLDLFTSSERSEDIGKLLRQLVRENPRDQRGNTVLHLCFSPLPDSLSKSEKLASSITWPSLALVDILLLLGADALWTDLHGNSVLHAAATHHSNGSPMTSDMFRMLVKRGAHVDQVNCAGVKAGDLLKEDDDVRQLLKSGLSLQCLCAAVISRHNIHYHGHIPASLEPFVRLHQSSS